MDKTLYALCVDFVKTNHQDNDADDIKLAFLKIGIKFSNVNAVFNKIMIDLGLRLSQDEKKKLVGELCSDADLMDETVFDAIVQEIVDTQANITQKSAIAYIRSWAKEYGVECFKKPRGGNGQGRKGFFSSFSKVLIKNPLITPDEVNIYVNSQPDREDGTELSQNVIKNASYYRSLANMANNIANSYLKDKS